MQEIEAWRIGIEVSQFSDNHLPHAIAMSHRSGAVLLAHFALFQIVPAWN
jgi:hypothetical protein